MIINKELKIDFIKAKQTIPIELIEAEKRPIDKRLALINKHFLWTQG
jgi:hypothetical protein